MTSTGVGTASQTLGVSAYYDNPKCKQYSWPSHKQEKHMLALPSMMDHGQEVLQKQIANITGVAAYFGAGGVDSVGGS